MHSVLDRVTGRERLRLCWALGFWAATYILFLAWNQLQSEFPSDLWQARRLLSTAFGAILFFGFTRLADGLAESSAPARLRLLLGGAIICCLAMVVGREVIDHFILPVIGDTASTLSRHTRFTLIWAGYFAGGALAFLSFAPAPATATEPRPEAASDEDDFLDALWVSRGRETLRVPVDAIDWIEAEGDYVRLHARTGGGLMRGTLSGLEARLDPAVFARVHRSAICRRSAVAAMLRKPSGAIAVRLDSGAEVPVGRSYRDTVVALLGPAREAASRLSA